MAIDQIKNVILDLGGVIINIDPLRTYQAFQSLTGKTISNTHDALDNYPLFSNYERGIISTDEFINQLKTEFKFNAQDDEIKSAWNAILMNIPEARHYTLLKLKQKFNLYLLSNTNELHRITIDQMIEDNFGVKGLNGYFDQVYTSYEMHLQKPEQAIFQQVLNEQLLNPNETLFIDDTQKHLNGANQLGIQTILATQSNDLPSIFGAHL